MKQKSYQYSRKAIAINVETIEEYAYRIPITKYALKWITDDYPQFPRLLLLDDVFILNQIIIERV